MIKLGKSKLFKFHFPPVKLYEIRKKVTIKNYLLYKDLQVWTAKFFHKVYIFLIKSKKYYWKSKIKFFNNNMCIYEKKRRNTILFISIISTNFDIVSDKTYIFHFNFKKYDLNSKIPLFKQNMWHKKRKVEMYNFTVGHFLIRYIFCVLILNIENQKLQELKLYICEESKTERKTRRLNIPERDDRIARSNFRAIKMCPRSGKFFSIFWTYHTRRPPEMTFYSSM